MEFSDEVITGKHLKDPVSSGYRALQGASANKEAQNTALHNEADYVFQKLYIMRVFTVVLLILTGMVL